MGSHGVSKTKKGKVGKLSPPRRTSSRLRSRRSASNIHDKPKSPPNKNIVYDEDSTVDEPTPKLLLSDKIPRKRQKTDNADAKSCVLYTEVVHLPSNKNKVTTAQTSVQESGRPADSACSELEAETAAKSTIQNPSVEVISDEKDVSEVGRDNNLQSGNQQVADEVEDKSVEPNLAFPTNGVTTLDSLEKEPHCETLALNRQVTEVSSLSTPHLLRNSTALLDDVENIDSHTKEMSNDSERMDNESKLSTSSSYARMDDSSKEGVEVDKVTLSIDLSELPPKTNSVDNHLQMNDGNDTETSSESQNLNNANVISIEVPSTKGDVSATNNMSLITCFPSSPSLFQRLHSADSTTAILTDDSATSNAVHNRSLNYFDLTTTEPPPDSVTGSKKNGFKTVKRTKLLTANFVALQAQSKNSSRLSNGKDVAKIPVLDVPSVSQETPSRYPKRQRSTSSRIKYNSSPSVSSEQSSDHDTVKSQEETKKIQKLRLTSKPVSQPKSTKVRLFRKQKDRALIGSTVFDASGVEREPLRPSDVLGGIKPFHEGNNRYISILQKHARIYRKESIEKRKLRVEKTTDELLAHDPPVRFLRNKGGGWFILNEREIYGKIYKGLNELRIPGYESGYNHGDSKPHSNELVQPKVVAKPSTKVIVAEDLDELEDEELIAMTQPPPLEEVFPSDKWSWIDKDERVLRFDLTSCRFDEIDDTEQLFLCNKMQQDDIVLVISGLATGLNPRLWSEDHLVNRYGCVYTMKARRYTTSVESSKRNNKEAELKEVGYVGLSISEFFNICHQKKLVRNRDREQLAESDQYYNCRSGDVFDLYSDLFYLIDLELPHLFPELYQDFLDNFKLKEALPGGKWCLANLLCNKSTPFFGPNLYIAFPGCFTQLHQDGFGTVDSGHLNVCGYNEVIMLRRLSHAQKKHACSFVEYSQTAEPNSKYDPLHGLPHDEKEVQLPSWPSNDVYEKWKSLKFILQPGDFVHINKGRLHAFRKLSVADLPAQDCHYKLRDLLLKETKREIPPLTLSIAWDWIYMGHDAKGVNDEVKYVLDSAALNKRLKRQSLAVPESAILRWTQKIVSDSCLESLKSGSGVSFLSKSNDTIDKQAITDMTAINSIAIGLYPHIQSVLKSQLAEFEQADALWQEGTLSMSSTTDEACLQFDPYESDYFCKLCNYELSNVYYHCNGCDEILDKDYNICGKCYRNSAYEIFTAMHERDSQSRISSLHHTGHFKANTEHVRGDECESCGLCSCCKCTCHKSFTFRYRFFDRIQLAKMLKLVENRFSTSALQTDTQIQNETTST